jgi:hypothetical protein
LPLPSSHVRSQILKISDLSAVDIAEMFTLFSQYYSDVSFEKFKSDLSEKTHVFVHKDESGWVGFSTIFRKKISGLPGTYLYSGDTVLKESHWGSKLHQMSFFKYIVSSKLSSPFSPVYWMLISKGFKTYMMMRRNFAESYPSPFKKTPEALQKIMDRFYNAKFGTHYSPKSGLIDFNNPQGAVKANIASPSPDAIKDPEISYFLKLNPNYNLGVELACITEIRFSDFIKHIPKYFLKTKKTVQTGQENG